MAVLGVSKGSRGSHAKLIKGEKNVTYLHLAKCTKMLKISLPFDPSATSRNLNQRDNQGCAPRLATRMRRIVSNGENFENKFKHETLDR